ncbi:hypothetical protein [Clostridium thermarum]|uniref:hypothetical protein n=1 Tax=Clostridium thermarum TaxID=1716543 RepID=UPI0011215888|nr:hypothetical protein [Clostridium thermarum]
MDINKAIRKQNRAYKRFMLAMCFIFFTLPVILNTTGIYNLFFLVYLIIIEALIILAMFIRKDSESLSYQCANGKIKISEGLKKKKYNINCEKVVFVHAEKSEGKGGIDIILLTTSKFRNKNIFLIDEEFLKKYAYVSHEYKKLKMAYPEEQYYYILIHKGGWIKYKLIMDIFKNCVRAKYSEESIEAIKLWKD